MDRVMCLESRIESAARRLHELTAAVQTLTQFNPVDEAGFSWLANDLVTKTERLTKTVRELALYAYAETPAPPMKATEMLQEITVCKANDVLEITMPFLLPKKNHKDTSFLCEPLLSALRSAAEKETLKISERAVVCFVHVYRRDRRGLSPRDYDNVEAKRVLDIIALFALTDDGAEFCDLYHTMQYGEENKTRILVMPQRVFERKIRTIQNSEKCE